ncbi:MAG: hypothetical protein ACRYE7_02245 [Janthinobacterium lividum]
MSDQSLSVFDDTDSDPDFIRNLSHPVIVVDRALILHIEVAIVELSVAVVAVAAHHVRLKTLRPRELRPD